MNDTPSSQGNISVGRDVSNSTLISGHGNTINQYAAPVMGSRALHQLPTPPPHFTGREAELERLVPLLETGGALIAGVRGMGGVGKSALAAVLGWRVRERYRDAQLFLDLGGASERPLSVVEALSYFVRAFEPVAKLPDDEAQLTALYRSCLKDKRALIVLDNAPADVVLDALRPPPGCALLVTSRFPVRLRGLQTVPLDELPPDKAQKYLLEVTPRIGALAAELAQLCGHLPLALELAAGALQVREELEPADYARRLRDERQRWRELGAVEAALALSYGLLDPAAQERWRALAVFPRSFDTRAAAAVWDMTNPDADADAALDALGALRDYSMLIYDKGERRWRLHDLARHYASGRLSAAERQQYSQRHAAHFCEVLSEAKELYKQGGAAVVQGLSLFDQERESVLAGQAWAAAHGGGQGIEMATRLCMEYPNAGVYVLDLRLHPRERIRWLEAQLVAARCMEKRNIEGYALGNLGLAYTDLGEAHRAIEYCDEALTVVHEIDDRRAKGAIMGNLGLAYAALGQLHRAIEYHEEQLVIAREFGDRRGEGNALGNLGNAYKNSGEPLRAIEYYEQILIVHREIGDRRSEGNDFGNLGAAYAKLGEARQAVAYYEQHRNIAREIGDLRGEGIALWNLSLSLDTLGERAQAIAHAEAALQLFEAIESPHAEMVRRRLAEWRG